MSAPMTAVSHELTWIDFVRAHTAERFQVDVFRPPASDLVFCGQPCAIVDCPAPTYRKDLCGWHYAQWQRGGKPDPSVWEAPVHEVLDVAECRMDRCIRSVWESGLCRSHQARWRSTNLSLEDWLAEPRLGKKPVKPSRTTCAVQACTFPTTPPDRHDLCDWHLQRYKSRHRKTREPSRSELEWAVGNALEFMASFYLHDLSEIVKAEVQYALQQWAVAEAGRLKPRAFNCVTRELRRRGTSSLLESDSLWVPGDGVAFMKFARREAQSLRDQYEGVTVWDNDEWRWVDLGFDPNEPLPATQLKFSAFERPWTKALAKAWARWRVSIGRRPNTVAANVGGLLGVVRLLESNHLLTDDPARFDRQVVERCLELIARTGHSRLHQLRLAGTLGLLLEENHQLQWEPRIPPTARVLRGELPKPPRGAPRGFAEYVMAQIEDEANLDKVRVPEMGMILRVLINSGLRLEDAVRLTIDCLDRDANGAAYLRFKNNKVPREAVVPIAESLALKLTAQADRALATFPGTRWLLPRHTRNPTGLYCYSAGAFKQQLNEWCEQIGLHTESGQPITTLAPHRFRHTLGSRLLNAGVPMEIVRQLLDHSSMAMTAHYARLHDATVRREWEKFRNQQVDIHGQITEAVGDGLSAAAWALENLSRAKQTLANGYCSRPLQQECPHPNACLTCPDFRTTAQFLPVHREQLTATLKLIKKAEASGQHRLVAINRPVAENLEAIIARLEGGPDGEPTK